MQLVLSTDNAHKLAEIRSILAPLGCEVLTKSEVGAGALEVIEDAPDLDGNAMKKARALHALTRLAVLADDTGLFVDALDGEPGVHSARYASEHDDAANREKLLRKLADTPDDKRTAYFETVLAYIDASGVETVVRGRVDGTITRDERGSHGFGYDSLFLPVGEEKTFAEMNDDEKNALSHRRRALDALAAFLR